MFMTVPYLRYALLAGSVPIRRGKGTNEKTRKESRMGEEEEAAAADFYGGALPLPGEGDLHPDPVSYTHLTLPTIYSV